MKRHTFQLAAVVALASLLLSAAIVVASPGFGITGVSTRGDGTISGPFKVNIAGAIKLQAHDDLRVFDQELTILPGGHTGWHSHPGPVLVTVKSGVFRYQEADCSYIDYGAGQTVVDEGGGHVHIGRNPSVSANTELSITYLVPPGAGLRIEADPIDCP